MRNFGLCQSVVCSDPAVLAEHLDNSKIEVTSVDPLNAKTVLISYITKKDWVEENDCSNIGNMNKIILI